MNKKLLFAAMLIVVSMINPGCKHEQMDSRKLYLKYLKSHIK
ncbi:hypothetical protein [Pedobacter sp. MC2016-24]|nr:hypothetical protein [Pedobacter sp. MC2016-24]